MRSPCSQLPPGRCISCQARMVQHIMEALCPMTCCTRSLDRVVLVLHEVSLFPAASGTKHLMSSTDGAAHYGGTVAAHHPHRLRHGLTGLWVSTTTRSTTTTSPPLRPRTPATARRAAFLLPLPSMRPTQRFLTQVMKPCLDRTAVRLRHGVSSAPCKLYSSVSGCCPCHAEGDTVAHTSGCIATPTFVQAIMCRCGALLAGWPGPPEPKPEPGKGEVMRMG